MVSKFKKNCDDYEEHVSRTILDSIEKSKRTRKLIENESKKLYKLEEFDSMSMSYSVSTQEDIPVGVIEVESNVMKNRRKVTSINSEFTISKRVEEDSILLKNSEYTKDLKKEIAFITPCKSSNQFGVKIDPRELQNDIDRDAIEAMK